MEIGARIQALRVARGITQERLAEAVGVTVQTVSRWENGVTLPDIALLPRLADYFDTTADDLLGMTRGRGQPKLIRTVETFEVATRRDAETLIETFRSEVFPRLIDWRILSEEGAVTLEVVKDFNVGLDRMRFEPR